MGLALLCALGTFAPGRVDAACNVLPAAKGSIRSNDGIVSQPFAQPGDLLEIALDPNCDEGAMFTSLAAQDYVITIAFVPPNGRPSVVALASNPGALSTSVDDCDASAAVHAAEIDPSSADFANAVQIVQPGADQATRRLRFRFPNTTSLVPGVNGTLAGPARIAVALASDPNPFRCSLATDACGDQPGLVACIDELFAEDGNCGTTRDPTFGQFTALPPPNDFAALCTDPVPPCAPGAPELRVAVDADGNLLIPMDWRGVLVSQDALPVVRLVRASLGADAFLDDAADVPILIPDRSVLSSFAPNGARLPPVFEPQVQAEEGDSQGSAAPIFFGSVDAPNTVLRVARRNVAVGQCSGGLQGLPCLGDEDCGGGVCDTLRCLANGVPTKTCADQTDCAAQEECGPGLFEFRDRLSPGINGDAVGPVVITELVDFAALDPVPIGGLLQTEELNVFLKEEEILARLANPTIDPFEVCPAGADLNADGDCTDAVVTLSDRQSNQEQPIGSSAGRALTRVRRAPFSFAAVAVDTRTNVVAYLEPEPLEGDCATPANCDQNGDGDVFDTLLRVLSRADNQAMDLLGGQTLTADAAPEIDGSSLQFSDGKLFFRYSEPDNAPRTFDTLRPDGPGSVNDTYLRPSLSGDGKLIAYDATDFDGIPTLQVYVKDLDSAAPPELVSKTSCRDGGEPSNVRSFFGSISPNGRYVVFVSRSTNLGDAFVCGSCGPEVGHDCCDRPEPFEPLEPGCSDPEIEACVCTVAPGCCKEWSDYCAQLVDGSVFQGLYLHDRVLCETERIDVDTNGVAGLGLARDAFLTGRGSVSDDGRRVVFESYGDLDPEVGCCAYVRDRVARTTELLVPSMIGQFNDLRTFSPVISGNGKHVAFFTDIELEPESLDYGYDVYVKNLEAGTYHRINVDESGSPLPAESESGGETTPSISHDGRWVAWNTLFDVDVQFPGSGGTAGHIYVHDRDTDEDGLFDEPGETATVRVSRASDSRSGNGNSGDWSEVSDDGRFTVFSSQSSNLLPGGATAPTAWGVYVHDRMTGFTRKVSEGEVTSWGYSGNSSAISADGRTRAYLANGVSPWDIAVERPDPDAPEITGDGDPMDMVLAVMDVAAGADHTPSYLCPALDTSVHDGTAAFLRPEVMGPTPMLSCPGGPLLGDGVDLNGDGDASDLVVHYWPGSGLVENLPRGGRPGMAAKAVSLSDSMIAVLVPEKGDGRGPLNGDGDTDDDVVYVYSLAAQRWVSTFQAASVVAAHGRVVAFITDERDQGGIDLNGNGSLDRILQVYQLGGDGDASIASILDLSPSAEDFVIGGPLGREIVAFRVSEAREGRDLNIDGDFLDDVLWIFDVETGLVVETGQAVTPCSLEACDPRVPYRVLDDTVRFLTSEVDQRDDLNLDGVEDDLVLQAFNLRRACATGEVDGSLDLLSSTTGGVCTNSGLACVEDADCGQACVDALDCGCFLPPGGCLLPMDTYCGCASDDCEPVPCPDAPAGQFCQPILFGEGAGECHRVLGSCSNDAECFLLNPDANCNESEQDFQRLADPLKNSSEDGGAGVLVGVGQCVEDLDVPCSPGTCGVGEFCIPSLGTCHRTHGTCHGIRDCPGEAPAFRCEQNLVAHAIRDGDGDEVPDSFDNCPDWPNVLQYDSDFDGVGDACDTQLCSGAHTVSRARVGVRGLTRGQGLQSLTFAGEFRMTAEEAATVDPMNDGVQIFIQDLTNAGTPLIELSHRTIPVPGSAAGCSPDGRDGWRTNRTGTRYTYRNRSNALPAGCLPGSAFGLRTIRIAKEVAGPDTVFRFRVRFVGASALNVLGPLRGTIVIGGEVADLAGACAASFLPPSRCRRGSGSISCKETAISGPFLCGDDEINGIEVCDGADVGAETCVTQDFVGGMLGCDAGCQSYDTSRCVTQEVCGDGLTTGIEICDGADIGAETCVTQGFVGGTLGCAADCAGYDTSRCMAAPPSCSEEDLGFAIGSPVITGTTAADDNDLVQSCGGFQGAFEGADRVHRWIAPVTGSFTIDTNGSLYDTVLTLYGSDCATEIACDDDGGSGFDSLISIALEEGDEILIVVEGFSEDQGEYTLNITMERWILHGDGTVTDRLTGLQWEMKTDDGSIHDKDNTYTWSSTGTDPDGSAYSIFLNVLNAGEFAGYDDWRLPTIDELQPISDPACSPRPCTTIPGETVSSFYWSSSSDAGGFGALGVNFHHANTYTVGKGLDEYVRAVRGGS